MIVPHNANNEIRTLTGVRAYAAVWVMLLHLQFSVGVSLQLGDVIGHGFWAVDIFFVLSGFILGYIYRGEFDSGFNVTRYRNYLAARFARIYPLHLLGLGAIAVYFLLRAIVKQSTGLPPNFDSYHFFLNLFLLHGWGYARDLSWNYPSWSISVEWFAYLLMLPLLSRYLRAWPPLLTLIAALAVWTGWYLVVSDWGEVIGEHAVHWAIPRIICEFSLGYALCRLFSRWQPRALLADGLVFGGLLTILLMCVDERVTEWWLAPAASALILGLAKPGPAGRWLFGNNWAVYWGERSYSIYMLHAVVQFYANVIMLRMPEDLRGNWPWAVLLAEVLIVLVCADLAYRWLEVPARRHLRRKLSSRKATSGNATSAATAVDAEVLRS